jgi:hypothetical protein
MEAAVSSETLVNMYKNARRDIQEEQNLATHCREELNWHIRYYPLQTGKNSTFPFTEQEDISLMYQYKSNKWMKIS